MKNTFYLIALLISFSLNALEVDIISSFNIEELPAKFLPVKKAFDLNTPCPTDYFIKKSPYQPDLVKIIVFDPWINREVIPKLPKEKLVLFLWEPEIFSPEFYNTYSKVYTWDDTLIDNVKFFRFDHPYLMPLKEAFLPFKEKKLCTMVVGHWTEPRLNILKFFEAHQPDSLECYGRCPPELERVSMYKGAIPGLHSGEQKIATLQGYRFCICFENTVGLQGYITEKIFSCFASGCIPIYWGADNIEHYIPKSCFIDYRDFASDEELYQFISSMPEERHQEYVDAIKGYLQSDEAQLFSPDYFDNLIYEAITQ